MRRWRWEHPLHSETLSQAGSPQLWWYWHDRVRRPSLHAETSEEMKTVTTAWTLQRACPEDDLDVFGVRVTILASTEETQGKCSVARIIARAGTGAPLHRHAEVERFQVLRGCLSVEVDGSGLTLHEGDAVTIAAWVAHCFANDSAEDVEFIAIATPGGHEAFFREADGLSRSGRFTPESAARLCASHGIELVP